jgi:hypothetical protein
MSEEKRDPEPGSRSLDAVDENPPRESEPSARLEEVREPADDDPPAEPRSPWNEVELDVPQRAPIDSSLDEAADEDPPSEPRAVESIPQARLGGR